MVKKTQVPIYKFIYRGYNPTFPETNIAPEKWMVGILLSYWEGNFSGAMLNFGRVLITGVWAHFVEVITWP